MKYVWLNIKIINNKLISLSDLDFTKNVHHYLNIRPRSVDCTACNLPFVSFHKSMRFCGPFTFQILKKYNFALLAIFYRV